MDNNPQTPQPAPVSQPFSLSAGMTLTLLNTDLAAILKHDQSVTKILVMPIDAVSRGMTIAAFIDEIVNMIKGVTGAEITFKADDINGLFSGFGLNLETLRITLRQAFLYWVKGGTFEYAFAIDITSDEGLTLPADVPKVFQLKSLSFAVWNTSRAKILERMGIGDIDSLLV